MTQTRANDLWFYLRDNNCVEFYKGDTRLGYVDVRIFEDRAEIHHIKDGISKAQPKYPENPLVHIKPVNCHSLDNVYRVNYKASGVIAVPVAQ